jgi:hypothetical protein
MSSKTIGLIVAIVGLLAVLLFALADVIGVGSQPGVFGTRQLIGVIVGAVVLIVGVVIFLTSKPSE